MCRFLCVPCNRDFPVQVAITWPRRRKSIADYDRSKGYIPSDHRCPRCGNDNPSLMKNRDFMKVRRVYDRLLVESVAVGDTVEVTSIGGMDDRDDSIYGLSGRVVRRYRYAVTVLFADGRRVTVRGLKLVKTSSGEKTI